MTTPAPPPPCKRRSSSTLVCSKCFLCFCFVYFSLFQPVFLLIFGAVSLENVLLDIRELGKGMELIRRECSLHDHPVLKGFVQSSDPQLDTLQRDAKAAEVFCTILTSLKPPTILLERAKVAVKAPSSSWFLTHGAWRLLDFLFLFRKPSTAWWATLERAPRRPRRLCSSPCLCASSRPTRWEQHAVGTQAMGGSLLRAESGFKHRTWCVQVQRQITGRASWGLTLELQLHCLGCPPPTPTLPVHLLLSSSGQPRPAPLHNTLPEIVLGLDLWHLLKEMYDTKISECRCRGVCLWNLNG